MSNCSDDSRLEQSNYLQIFEQFFDRADDLNERPCFQKLSPKSQFPKSSMHDNSKTITGNCLHHASADHKNDMNKLCSYSQFSHPNNKNDTKNNKKSRKNNNDETYNRENVKNLTCRKNTTYLRRNMLKRQNGFCEDDEEEEEEDDKKGVLNFSVLDQLEDDVFEMNDRKHSNDVVTNGNYKNDLINSTISLIKATKPAKNQNSSNVSCKNRVYKNRRTSVPLQSINLQNNYDYNLESNCKKKKHNKSQSFKHACKQYYFNTENKNQLNNANKSSPFFYAKQRKPKTPILVDSFRSSENPTKYRHHSHEQFSSHEDPAQKKLQLVRLMQGLDCTVVRSFVTSSKGLVNRGDSFRKRMPQVTPDLVIGCLPYLQVCLFIRILKDCFNSLIQ